MIHSTRSEAIRAPLATSLALGAALALLSPSSAASPTAHEIVAAEALFRAGRELVAAGRYEEGCPKFQASFEQDPSAGTLLNIARCHEHEGKLVAAHEDYERALVLARDGKDPARQKVLDTTAHQAMSALEPRLAQLRITLAVTPPGLKVVRDGQELTGAALSSSVPVDPGRHEVSASAPGYRTETRAVALEEGKSATVEITLTAEPKRVAHAAGVRPVGIGLTIAGGAGLGLGGVAGILALNKVSAVQSGCGGTTCLASDKASRDGVRVATTLGTVSTVGFIGGGVLAAAGVVIMLVPAGSDAKPAAVGVIVGPAFAGIQGTF